MNMPSHNTVNSITALQTWLEVSREIMASIESESKPSKQQVSRVGQEWAGTLSRLAKSY